ncbi:Hypothetical_protein [Hexamita inflata]|uniref:Hypothetical_protein n=1 Tax=Hexamita inflata TaxID=28002 RepID=A0AA86TTK2_9EUKA|nr:Hypothetical protein HINF_LOCUS14027 [Hexamita inflata]
MTTYNYCVTSDWFYGQDWSTCQSECYSDKCNIDADSGEYCCPSQYSTRNGTTGPWWIAIIFVVIFILVIVLSCWQMQMRRQRMLMMMSAQQRMVMGNGIVQSAVVYTQPIQQPQQIQMIPQNYSVFPHQIQQNSQIGIPSVM